MSSRPSLGELARVFLKLSLLGFGGPNAHLALMLEEVVERRGWLTREHFLELMAVTNLLPGPNSSEVAIHIGYSLRGWRGALVTGGIFLLPTFVMVTALSALYFAYGTLPQVEPVLWALKPVILAVIVRAGFKLAGAAVKDGLLAALAVVGVVVGFGFGGWVVPVMALGGLVTWMRWRRTGPSLRSLVPWPAALLPTTQGVAQLVGLAAGAPLLTVFVLHLVLGSVLFGGGYVLVILLEPWAVQEFGWLTSSQFLDGVAITQVVPGPISTLSAFVGYAAAGLPGAVAGTLGVYLPAFAAVLIVAPYLERIRQVEGVKAYISGVSGVVAGGILGVAGTLAGPSIPDYWAAGLGLGTLALLLTGKISPTVAVLGGLTLGVVRFLVTG